MILVTVRWLHTSMSIRLTRFTLNASARCSAPTSPIRFSCSSSVDSVCDPCLRDTTAYSAEWPSHLVHSQCSSQMLRTCGIHLVVTQVQSCQCLRYLVPCDDCREWIMAALPGSLSRPQPDVPHLQHQSGCLAESMLSVSMILVSVR